MSKKSWFQVCKDAFQMLMDRDKYAYFYGAKNGIVLTTEVMNALWNASPDYFRRYNADQKAQIFRNSYLKRGYDCSGFVCVVTGETGYSTSIYEKRTAETTLAEGVAGQFLYTTWGGAGRHIEIDAGFGFSIGMGYESTDENVRLNRDSVHLSKITDIAWEHSFQTDAVNYNGSYGTDPNGQHGVDPAGMTATVVNCNTLYLRQAPTKQADTCNIDRADGKGIRDYLFAGETATIINKDGEWYQVYISGCGYVYWTPWINANYVRVSDV